MSSIIQQETIKSRRFESKYRISSHQYYQIKSALVPYMQLDKFTNATPRNKYRVRSLYFDTLDYQAYFEKISGDCDRVKFRIRTYAETLEDNPTIRVELKVRKGILMEKYSYFVTTPQYQEFMNEWHWPVENSPVLGEFERSLQLKHLRPKILVEYLREGYRSRSRENVRITFDHQVRSAFSTSLFPEKVFFRSHHPHVIVLEIKQYEKQPGWLRNIIQQHSLKTVANSKYAQGIEVARPDLVTPSWSIG